MSQTLAEMQADLDATIRDIGCLTEIVANLETFIFESNGEDRSAFKVDLLKYRSLMATAQNLKPRIVRAMAEKLQTSITDGLTPFPRGATCEPK